MSICFCTLKGRANTKKLAGKFGGTPQIFSVPNSP